MKLFHRIKISVFVLLLFLSSGYLSSYGQVTPYYFKNYQDFDGLSSNTITAVIQDKKGFMWFGTRNGLNRFDGHAFKIFKNEQKDTTSIGSNSIFSLYEDPKERLWVGTYKGIYLYDPLTEKFSAFNLIPQGEVRYIKADYNHHVWILSDWILYSYNEKTGVIKSYPLVNDHTITFNIGENGLIWSATDKGFVNKYIPRSDLFQGINIAKYNNNKNFSSIQDLYPVGDSSLMIGTLNQAVLFNFKSSTISNLFDTKKFKDVQTHVIFHQFGDEYWLGSESGLFVYNLKSGKTTLVAKEYSNPYSITDNIISSIYRDSEGGTWVGTYFGGINYYSASLNNFKKYFPEPGTNSLSGNIVHEICKDQEGNLWVGTEDAGLNQVNIRTGLIRHFMPSPAPGAVSYNNIHGLVIDNDRLWIGTYEHGLDVMDLKTCKVIRHYSSKDAHSFGSNFIVSLYRTKKGDILVGTWLGMFKYDRAADNFTAMPFFTDHIQSIYEDSKETIWSTSYGGGVYYMNAKTREHGHLVFQKSVANGLINNYVNGLFQDSSGRFWFSTEGGLSRFDPFTKQFVNYSIEDGLPDNQIFRVLEDKSHKLWISTAKGLVRFDPETKAFETFHIANGLPTEQFNYNSSFRDIDGTMYFGTVKGMIAFQPSKLVKNPYVPKVFITGLQIDNQEPAIDSKKSILHQSVTYTHAVTLKNDSANISFDVAALNFIIPEMNRYSYKMDGLDKYWTTITKNRKIYYTKLPPGNYTFMIKGANNDGLWNPQETHLSITVMPPIWETIWAYIFYCLIIIGVVWLILRYYLIAVNEKSKRRIETIKISTEREIYNSKIEFFTNIAHEIRTPLTLIKLPLDKLLNNFATNDTETNYNLKMMKKNTNRLIDLTDQLLDFRKIEANNYRLDFSKTDVNELLQELYSDFKPTAEEKGLLFELEMPRITLTAYINAEAFRKIVSNLFNNAIKYAQQKISVKLLPFNSDDNLFHLEVRSDGYIIAGSYKEKIFEPFFRIKETERQAGTGIGLPLSRSLAELHKGSLVLSTPNEKVNIFLLSLPIHQEFEIDFGDNNSDQPENTLQIQVEPRDKSLSKILLVEDNIEILNYLERDLSANFNIRRANNGGEALAVLAAETIHLVVSDIMMPVMDGIELCQRIKTDIQLSHIPIVLLTAKNSLNSKIEGLEVGADAYIEKPFSVEHLIAQVKNLLNNRKIIKEYFALTPLTHIKGIACSTADREFLEHLNDVIIEHITNMDLEVEQISSLMNMSRPTLYRKIKEISDLTPKELINIIRLKRAAELLAEGKYKINEVSNMVGYSLPTNFTRDFQRQFGINPSNYLNNLKAAQKP